MVNLNTCFTSHGLCLFRTYLSRPLLALLLLPCPVPACGGGGSTAISTIGNSATLPLLPSGSFILQGGKASYYTDDSTECVTRKMSSLFLGADVSASSAPGGLLQFHGATGNNTADKKDGQGSKQGVQSSRIKSIASPGSQSSGSPPCDGNQPGEENQPPSPPSADTAEDIELDESTYFSIGVGDKVFRIDKQQLSPEMRGHEEPGEVKACEEDNPEQCWPLGQLESIVFNPASDEDKKKWLASYQDNHALDYLLAYGTPYTKEILCDYYKRLIVCVTEDGTLAETSVSPGFFADKCAICLESLVGKSGLFKLKCNHLLDPECLHSLQEKFEGYCPECRATLNYPDPVELEARFREAAKNGEVNWLTLLLDLGTAINGKDAEGNTALHFAYQYSQASAIDFLISKGVDRDITNKAGLRPIDLAPQVDKSGLIVAAAAIENRQTIFEQVAQGKERRLSAYLCGGGNPNNQNPRNQSTLLNIAVEHGHHALMELLLGQPGIEIDKANELGNTPLMIAAARGDLAMVQQLLDHGADWQKLNSDHMNALMFAVQHGHISVVAMLLNREPDSLRLHNSLKRTDRKYPTALILAAQGQHLEIAKLLVNHGAEIHDKDFYGKNALMYAVDNGHLELTRLLSRRGAHAQAKGRCGMDIEDDHGYTALENAARSGRLEVLKCLIEVHASFRNALMLAVKEGHGQIVEELLRRGADVNQPSQDKDSYSPLHHAVKANQLAIIKMLAAAGANIDVKNAWAETPLLLAVKENHFDLYHTLAELEADINSPDILSFSPLNWAVRNKHWLIIRDLVNRGAETVSLGDSGSMIMFEAAHRGDARTINSLVTEGRDVNKADQRGCTPLYYAAREGRLNVVLSLIELGAYIDFPCTNGDRAMEAAVHNGYWHVVKVFTDLGLDINRLDSSGLGVLHYAAASGELDSVKALVRLGADVEVLDKNDFTPLHHAELNGHVMVANALKEGGASFKRKSLHYAAANGYLDDFQVLVERGADLNRKNADGETPLTLAAFYQHWEAVRTLVRLGAEIDKPNEEGQTPLNIAASNGYWEIVRTLICLGANVETPDNAGRTPLFAAVYHGHPDTVRTIIKLGHLDVNRPELNGDSPLHIAAREGHVEVIKTLVKQNADVHLMSEGGDTALAIAVSNDRWEAVRTLVELKADLNQLNRSGYTPLLSVVADGKSGSIIRLVELGADVNQPNGNGNVALHFAALNGDSEAINVLRSVGANIDYANKQGNTALHFAAFKGEEEAVRTLIQLGANVSKTNLEKNTPLFMAVSEGHSKAVSLFLTLGSDVNRPDAEGETLLHIAAARGHSNVVQVLIEKGANVNEVNTFGKNTALHYAARHGQIKVIRELVGSRADINQLNHLGYTPLHEAAIAGFPDAITELHCLGADVNIQDKIGSTALHFAARKGFPETARKLAEVGTRINLPDQAGKEPLYYAARQGHVETTRVLNEFGARIVGSKDFSSDFTGFPVIEFYVLPSLAEKQKSSQWQKEIADSLLHCTPSEFRSAISRGLNANLTINNYPLLKMLLDFSGSRETLAKATMLLENGADPTVLQSVFFQAHDNEGVSGLCSDATKSNHRLFMAAQDGNLKVIKMEVKKLQGKTTYLNFGNALYYASLNGHSKIVSYLLSHNVKPNHARQTENATPLHAATRNNHLPVIRLLLAHSANPELKTHNGESPLDIARNLGHSHALKLLATEAFGGRLDKAINDNKHEQCELFLNEGVDPDHNFSLHQAATRGSDTVALQLIKANANVNRLDCNGQSPLHLAVLGQHFGVIGVLASCPRIDINAYNTGYETALHLAASQGGHPIVNFLLAYGGMLNLTDHSGNTVIHLICRHYDDQALMQFLQANKGRITGLLQQPRNHEGQSALEVLYARDDISALTKASWSEIEFKNQHDKKKSNPVQEHDRE